VGITIFCRHQILAGNKDYGSISRAYPCNDCSLRVLGCDNLEMKCRDASKIQNEQRYKNYTEFYGFWPLHKVDCINAEIKGLYCFCDLKCLRSCTYTVSVASSALSDFTLPPQSRRKLLSSGLIYAASTGNFFPTFRDNL